MFVFIIYLKTNLKYNSYNTLIPIQLLRIYGKINYGKKVYNLNLNSMNMYSDTILKSSFIKEHQSVKIINLVLTNYSVSCRSNNIIIR